MSVVHSSAVWKCLLPDSGAKLVLLKLADHADENGLAWPSLATIARDTSLALSTVKQKIAWLHEAGFIQRHSSTDRIRSNRYVLSLEKIHRSAVEGGPVDDLGRPSAEPPVGPGWADGRPGVGRELAGGGPVGGHESSVNHQRTMDPPLPSARVRGVVSDSPPTEDQVFDFTRNATSIIPVDVARAWLDTRQRDGWKLRKEGHLYEFEDWRSDLRVFARVHKEIEDERRVRQNERGRRGADTRLPPSTPQREPVKTKTIHVREL